MDTHFSATPPSQVSALPPTPANCGVGCGAQLLDAIEHWFGRFIAATDPDDLKIVTLWAAHTHLAAELYTSPRLMIDSTLPGSGKTTLLDHLNRLCKNPVQTASLSSPALIPRLLERGPRTILLDEVDRSLHKDKQGVGDLLAILNSGYRVGASRPVLVPGEGGGWEPRELPTFAPVAMAGNSPALPADTVSRSIRVLLMPDLHGTVEDSDWEHVGEEADALRAAITSWADTVRDHIKGLAVELPAGCIGRAKDKWRPMMRVATAAGGTWPAIAGRLIQRSMEEDAAERESGLQHLPPGMVLLTDLHAAWPGDAHFVPTRDLVQRVLAHNSAYWGVSSPYGKALTDARFGSLLNQAAKLTSIRPGGRGNRGYLYSSLAPVWQRLGISGGSTDVGADGEHGAPGAGLLQLHRLNRAHQPSSADTAA